MKFDKRGSGDSSGNLENATIEDLAQDTLAALNWLKARSDIDSTQIGLVGHSEGGTVASLAASRSKDVAFVILLSAPAVSAEQLSLASTELRAKASGRTDEEVKAQLEEARRILKSTRTAKHWERVKADIRKRAMVDLENVPEEQRKDIDVDQLGDAGIKQMQSPGFRYFLEYDPSSTLEEVTCPLLALYGELDLIVPPAMNEEALVHALNKGGNNRYEIRVLPDANHYFMKAEKGLPTEMFSLEKAFVPGLLDLVTNWIVKQDKRQP